MVRNDFFLTERGFTLMELLVALLLVSFVFLAGISVYTTSFKFLRTAQNTDVTKLPVVSLEAVAKRISVGNLATADFPGPLTGSQLNVRADFQAVAGACGTFVPLNTPNNTADDGWWHFKFNNGPGNPALRTICDNTPGTNVPGGMPAAVLIDNVSLAASSFTLSNPSFPAGIPTVVRIHVLTTVAPVSELDTDVAVGAMPKR